MKSDFAERVRAVVRAIPQGETMTYGQVAAAAGHPGAARAVGSIMRRNYDPSVPCHRVIRANGTLGEYNRGGPEEKRRKLIAEGVPFESGDNS
ncbi:MAG TPA: MGMT family protein [Candidatus Paceibacterota bacterium]|nr:MGMT family protein [Candidatus Paceibacterota bacterium]